MRSWSEVITDSSCLPFCNVGVSEELGSLKKATYPAINNEATVIKKDPNVIL